MGRTSEISKRLRPKIVPLRDSDRCIICGVSKPLERSHVIPQQLLFSSPKVNKPKFIDYDGINTLIMCRNHHRLYEIAQLDNEDFALIWARVLRVWIELLNYYSSLVKEGVSIPENHLEKLATFISKFEKYGKEETRRQ